MADLDGTLGLKINGVTSNGSAVFGDRLGTAVSGTGDFNGDGFDDVMLGASLAESSSDGIGNNRGAAYVFLSDRAATTRPARRSAAET